METSSSPRQRDVRKRTILNCACQPSQQTGGTLEDCLLIAMTELLCCWEKRRVAVEDSCERGAVFQVQSVYESLCWRGCYSAQYPNASQPYVSRPINTISVSSRSWSSSPATLLVLLDLKSACVSILCRLAVISRAILLASQLQACYLHLNVYQLTMQLKMHMDYFC